MPRYLQQLRIFMASPADVQQERMRIENVVREMNLILSSEGSQLELLGWETHAYPEFGPGPQACNQQSDRNRLRHLYRGSVVESGDSKHRGIHLERLKNFKWRTR